MPFTAFFYGIILTFAYKGTVSQYITKILHEEII